MGNSDHISARLLAQLSSDPETIKILKDYTENKFTRQTPRVEEGILPMQDEPFAAAWKVYADSAKTEGVFATLKSKIVQLQFPVQDHISETQSYRGATLKGQSVAGNEYDSGFSLKQESSLSLRIHQGIAGSIPVLITENEDDFYLLVQALCYKNEPVYLPASMGAAMIRGLNNWDRLKSYEHNWSLNNPFGDWKSHFINEVLPDKRIYQDKIIVLSSKGYSGTCGKDLGIDQQQWLDISLQIRLQHEYAHYFTLRYFGHMANNMHDELVADYAGINKVLGKFSASWFLRFIGLHEYPKYQQGGRLENYINKDQFSDQAFSVLCRVLYDAAKNVEKFDDTLGSCSDDLDRCLRMVCLCQTDLVSLSANDGLSALKAAYFELQKTYNSVKNEE